ncbi:hypothetical protein A2947_02355 [Candidatus Peribacteria bacterium RIFCSPLOWO2_01_FULL_54_110]|nr:MAG: hypothetical protein A2947_02355 [Candidatus Peribacteria bacterium RIFCSPLOWO2_01_FULL_54_110]
MNTERTPPVQCHLWKKDKLVFDDLIWDKFDHIRTFVDTSHYSTDILRCKECGQLYYFEWYEHIDWLHGNDPQHWTFIPIDSEEAAEDMLNKLPIELLQINPRLQYDWPHKEGRPEVRWIGK